MTTHEKIAQLLAQNPVLLFMKGTPAQPRCGFSDKAVNVLNALVSKYESVDVLADDEMRQGIKSYGNWPTIPQLYVRGELIGGSDIIIQLYNTGELHHLLGVSAPDRTAPEVFISDAAAEAIRSGMSDEPNLGLHLQINSRWQANFQLAQVEGHEIKAAANGVIIHMDLQTAARAKGLKIDWVSTLQGEGLSITNPNAPTSVKSISVKVLDSQIKSATAPLIVDVRPEHDRLRVPFPPVHKVLDAQSQFALEALPKDQPLAFLCHFGNSSKGAAEHFRSLGFTEVFNIEGGIDAYALEIDASVARY